MTLTLRPSDAVNLADDKAPCPACAPRSVLRAFTAAGVLAAPGEWVDSTCQRCKGKGMIPVDTGRRRLSHSLLKDYLSCPRRYELDRVQRIEPISRRAYLEMGSAFQAAIEHRDPALGRKRMLESTDVRTQDEEDQLRIDAATVFAAAHYYLRRWPASDQERRELEYLIRLRNPATGAPSQTFDLHGFADGVMEYPDHLEVVENKLLSRLDVATVRQLRLDQQISLECYALWRATGKPVTRVFYRIVKKPSIRQRKGRSTKNGIVGAETVDEFIDRLTHDYLEPDRQDFYGHEEVLTRNSDDLLRTEAELWRWAAQLRDSHNEGIFARNTASCADYGGCRFAPLCCHEEGAAALYRKKPDRLLTPAVEEAA